MQRPEAWPRPHPGEGAAAAQAGGPAPPVRAGEPAGLREPSLYTIKAVFILDNDGHRLLAKYYDDTFPSLKEQMAFEKNVFNKTSRTDSEIAFFGGMTIVYKSSIDLFLYVVGSSNENELMLMSVLTCLFESLSHVLRKNVEKRWLLENMDGAFLVLDEIVDGGVILESDAQQVIQKVNFRADDSSLTEQSVAQVSLPRLILLFWNFLPRALTTSCCDS
ncbi:Coatomer subunit zeta-2 [Vulpes lagopus]|uniref:coatomer subunit zeta-2 isoform X2 n=1 Tax=Vulpes lagopus TaxID=494514 RepID=UPI001BC8E1D3|nr:coatomer subunit zeta-2 isoform X2 [Vulpes lagopus]